tara:strand:+ start:1659 stop:3176 length:1518 start_codon:yes stop_codon:yes gene_type:complete
MAGAVIEVKYFNSFVLKKTNKNSLPIWNGSYGIPASKGGYPVVTSTSEDNSWAIEESRVRGGYNNTSTDYGARAYLVEEDPQSSRRGNALIYSGIFNSRTGINQTNVFSTAEDITKAADPANGSIQKLHAQDSNLVIFQERKISRALIDKDAIYSAEGSSSITSSNLTIGVIQPYAGKFGISTNPESFAVYGYNKYFSDKNNNVILRLTGQGLEEISKIGMRDFFRDKLNSINTSSGNGEVVGGYDIHNGQYVASLQQPSSPLFRQVFNTVSYDEAINGWTSRFAYAPQRMFSLGASFYSVQNSSLIESASDPTKHLKIWKHYDNRVLRGSFYGNNYPTNVTFVLNAQNTVSKNFKTIGYEGSNGWTITSYTSDSTGKDFNFTTNLWVSNPDTTNKIYSYTGGEYVINPATGLPVSRANYAAVLGTNDPNYPRYYAGFHRKENRYVSNLIQTTDAQAGEVLFGGATSGIKGFFVLGVISTDTTTDYGGEKQLFSVVSDYSRNNGY